MSWPNPNWRRSLPVQHERGYLIPAINTTDQDYERCARVLRESILDHHPAAHVTIVTADMLPEGDQGGYANDWQCFRVSPYRETIKLEADMIAAGPIDHWWSLFELRDVVISVGARDIYDQTTAYRGYRKTFDHNQLPDVYNAVTYWRLSTHARDFFSLVRSIFQHWPVYRTLLKWPDEQSTTDVVYAMAAEILGRETVTLPPGLGPQIVHMKSGIIPLRGRDWTREMIWELDPVRINTVAQWGLVHYNVKSWVRQYQNERQRNH
jgi:hypothetical protein